MPVAKFSGIKRQHIGILVASMAAVEKFSSLESVCMLLNEGDKTIDCEFIIITVECVGEENCSVF